MDPGRFEVLLAYNIRPGNRPDTYEAGFPPGVRKIRVPEMVRPIRPLEDLTALWKLYRLFREERPDAVHAHSSKAGFLARLAALAAGVPRIFYSPLCYSFRMADAPRLSRALYLLAEALVSRIGHIVVQGPAEVPIARRLAGPGRVLPFFSGVEVERLRPEAAPPGAGPSGGGPPPLTIVTCGRVSAQKNPEAFVRLCAALAPRFPSARFVWVGGGESAPSQALLDYARSLGLEDRFRMTGWLPAEAALLELRRADLVVHFSSWDVAPFAVLEAMALGKAVVGSPAADTVVHGETGYVAGNERRLQEYAGLLLGSPALRGRMGSAARRTVERDYSFSRLVRQLESAYEAGVAG